MAAAAPLQDLCEESTCSTCLKYFQDPVTTECEHNLCLACLAKCWDNSGGEEISCPQCRQKVQRKLILNRQLANIVELTRRLHIQEGKSPEGKEGVCGKHQEPLKLFCKDDVAPICLVCDRSKEHRNHTVVTLEEAARDYQDQILELLEKERAKIVGYKVETEEESQELLRTTEAEMEKMKEQFRELHSLLNEKEKLLLTQLEEVEKETAKKRDKDLARLSGELFSLKGLIQEMEKKCQQLPADFLQDVRSILERREKKETFQYHITFLSELNVKISEVCDRNNSLVGLMKQFKDSLLSQPLRQGGTLMMPDSCMKANVTLDPDTAHPLLVLSQDRKSVDYGRNRQALPDNPERFNRSSYVLGREGFTAGRHYWEVTVGKEGDWAVGVARKSIRRKGNIRLSTEEGIWAIGKYTQEGRESEYVASNPPKEPLPPLSRNLRRIRVSLNYEKVDVAFHDGDSGSHLHTFSGVSFSGETLLPLFYVNKKASLTIST